MIFKDLKPGDKFYIPMPRLDGVYVKTRYDNSKSPLHYRDTNAVRLDDGHCMVVGQNVPVVKIENFLN